MCLVPFAAQFWTSNIQIAVQVAMSALGRSKSAPLTGLSAAGPLPGASSPDIGFVGRLLYTGSVPSAEQMHCVDLVVFCGDRESNSSHQCSARSCFVPPLSGPSTEWLNDFHYAVMQTAITLSGDRAVVVCPSPILRSPLSDTFASQLLFAALVKTLSGLEVEDTLSEIGAWDGYFGSDEWKVHQDVIPNQTLCFCKLFDLFLLVV